MVVVSTVEGVTRPPAMVVEVVVAVVVVMGSVVGAVAVVVVAVVGGAVVGGTVEVVVEVVVVVVVVVVLVVVVVVVVGGGAVTVKSANAVRPHSVPSKSAWHATTRWRPGSASSGTVMFTENCASTGVAFAMAGVAAESQWIITGCPSIQPLPEIVAVDPAAPVSGLAAMTWGIWAATGAPASSIKDAAANVAMTRAMPS